MDPTAPLTTAPPPIPAPPPTFEAAARFSAGTLISRTFSVWSQNVVPFGVAALVLHAPPWVLSLAGGPPTARDADVRYTGFAIAAAVVAWFTSFLAVAGITYGVIQAMRGARARLAEVLAFGFHRFLPVFGTSFATGIRIVLWSLLFFVPGVMAYCRYFVAIPARIAEPALGPDTAVARSAALTEGHRFAVFVAALLFWIIGFVVAALVGVLGATALGVPFAVKVTLEWTVQAVAASLGATAAGVAYHDLRIEKEGVDTAQLAAVFE